jgi:RNA polymerase sigma-70 factor (ECF subfamily)
MSHALLDYLRAAPASGDDPRSFPERVAYPRSEDDRGSRSDEADAVARVRTGDADAFARLFRVHYAALHRFAHSLLHDADRSDDVVQDVFTTIWSSHATWAPTPPLGAYLFRAVRNRALERFRHDAVVSRTESMAMLEASSPGAAAPLVAPDVQADLNALEVRLARAIQELPERQRSAILLRWHYDMPPVEIAQVLEVSAVAIRKLLAKAEAALRWVVFD